MMGTASADFNVKNMIDRVIAHPDTVHQEGRATLLVKEKIKPEGPSEYDWLWYMHEINVIIDGEIKYAIFEVRKYQSTGNSPDSAIRVSYTVVDFNLDGIPDREYTDIHMIMLEEPHEGSLIGVADCPDDVCKYEFKNIQEVYKDELEFWQNKLQ
jgi:hypothetical protein